MVDDCWGLHTNTKQDPTTRSIKDQGNLLLQYVQQFLQCFCYFFTPHARLHWWCWGGFSTLTPFWDQQCLPACTTALTPGITPCPMFTQVPPARFEVNFVKLCFTSSCCVEFWWAVNVQSTAAMGKGIPRHAVEAAPLKRGLWRLWLKGNKTPKTIKSLPFVSVLSHLINLKGIFMLALTVLKLLKLQFYSLCTQLFRGRQNCSFTPRADCHFSPHNIWHAHQETTQISPAAFPAACATGSEPVVLPSTSMRSGTKSLDRFTGIILCMQIRCQGHKCSFETASSSEFQVLEMVYRSLAVTAAECSEICVFTWACTSLDQGSFAALSLHSCQGFTWI